jgi:hypothetical protein
VISFFKEQKEHVLPGGSEKPLEICVYKSIDIPTSFFVDKSLPRSATDPRNQSGRAARFDL